MKKICLFFSLMLCFLVQNGYAQTDGAYDNTATNTYSDGGCPPEQPVGDCYCLYCRYEPKYYNVWRCEYCPQYSCKRCCRYVPQYYQQQCCRYVPQYYCKTCCKYVPQYYSVPECRYVPKYRCEKRCTYVPKYYYKHTNCNNNSCAPSCPQESAPAYGSYDQGYQPSYGGGGCCPVNAGGYAGGGYADQYSGGYGAADDYRGNADIDANR